MATAGKEQWEKQLNLSKTKSKTLIKKKEKQKVRKKKKKKPKMNFFLAFFDKKHKEENSTVPQKTNMDVEICSGNKTCDL